MAKRKRTPKQRARQAAKRLPHKLQDVAFTKFKPKRARRIKGTFGPASDVRHIDTETYDHDDL